MATLCRHRRAPLLGILVATVAVGLSPASAATDQQCKVEMSSGWSSLAGRGTITMRNVGKPCGSMMYSVPDTGVAVDTITLEVAPQKGTVKIDVPRFAYTPQAGFTGRDRFTLAAEGPDRSRLTRVKLRGEIVVQVNP